MSTHQGNISKKKNSKMAGAGLLVAFTASLCCITPVLALISGIGGVAATFSWMEPFRPYLIGLTVAVLGFAWYQKLKPRTPEEIECDCENDGKEPFIQSKNFLGIVSILATVMLTFPSYSHIFYPEAKNKSAEGITVSNIQQIDLEIAGMTCTGCEEHVTHASYEVDGVLKAVSSYEEGSATIVFDNTKTTKEEVINAVNATGYSVTSDQLREPTLTILKNEKAAQAE